MLITICLLTCVLNAACALAGEIIPLAEPGYVLPYGGEADLRFTPAGEYRSVRLVYTVRMDSPRTAGSTYVLALSVNGEPVRAAVSRRSVRLLNKPLETIMPGGLRISWAQSNGWRVVYAPDFTPLGYQGEVDGRLVEVSAYRFVLDITDLVRPNAENVVQMVHRGAEMNLREYFREDNPTLDLVFKELAIELSDEPPVIAPGAVEEEFSADRIMIQPPAVAEVAQIASVTDGGGLTITLPGLDLEVVSRFSFEGGGFNTLTGHQAAAEGQPEWRVERAAGDGETVVRGRARDYELRRSVNFAGDHLVVTDHLRNLTDRDIGLAWGHELRAPLAQIADAFIGGSGDPGTVQVARRENSTVFVQGERAGCGLIALDDVSRLQGVLYWDHGGAAGVRSDVFCLAAGSEYTLRWAVYPVLRPDYFDFINLCRRDLNVNFTVPGGFSFDLNSFASGEPDALRAMIAQRGLSIVASGTWSNVGGDPPYYHGAHMLQAASIIERLRTACARAREIAPDLTTLVYMHSFINTDPETPEKYPDALITNADGTPYIQPSYTRRYGINFYYAYPAVGNSYLPAMKRVLDMIMDDIGAGGVYWDEVDMISPQRTYDRWDGFSAELDDEHRIARKFGDPHLLSLEAKLELIDYLRSKGGMIIGNSAPTTQTLTDVHFPRFVETANYWYPARAHLYTPISLGDHLTVKTFEDLLRDIRDKLMLGTVYYYYARPQQPYPTITQHMFPFTPVELHRGWVLGRERLITCVPGTFTLGDADAVRVYWYGADGALTDRTGEERVEKGRRLVRLDLAEGEMAVIERE